MGFFFFLEKPSSVLSTTLLEFFHDPLDSEVSDTVSKLGEDVALFQQSVITTRNHLQEMIAAVDHDSLNV